MGLVQRPKAGQTHTEEKRHRWTDDRDIRGRKSSRRHVKKKKAKQGDGQVAKKGKVTKNGLT